LAKSVPSSLEVLTLFYLIIFVQHSQQYILKKGFEISWKYKITIYSEAV